MPSTLGDRLAMIAAAALVGFSFGIPVGAIIAGPDDEAPVRIHSVVTDAPMEDEPGWSCVDNGNHICGPGNANGAPAGCYDTGGVMVAPWPCHVVVNQAGEGDVYAGTAATDYAGMVGF